MNEPIQNGVKPTKLDKRDFSFNKTFGAIVPMKFPESFDLDAGFYMPNQNIPNEYWGIPAMPFGCTEYSANEICSDQDNVPYNPYLMETILRASANGGIDMRTPLGSLCKDGVTPVKGMSFSKFVREEAKKNKRAAYFRVGQNPDYFDGMRAAMLINKRSVTIGTPWFDEWNTAGWSSQNGIMPMPDLKTVPRLPWHCYKISGWVTINEREYLKCKPWCGPHFGDKGWIYISRETFNMVMTVMGTAAFTVAAVQKAQIQTVGTTYVFKKNLSFLMRDPDIAELQKALQSLGYEIAGAVTTYFGVNTKKALARFQADYGISDNGDNFGPLTRYQLNRLLNPTQTLYGAWRLFVETFFT